MRRQAGWALACVLGLGCGRQIDRDGAAPLGADAHAAITARRVNALSTHESAANVRATIAERSHAATTIEDRASGLRASYVPAFGHDVPGDDHDGVRVMRDVAPNVDVARRARLDGVEEYAVLASAVAGDALTWTLRLGDRVAGLRLVDDVLELLDAGGAPRLRVPRPFVVDATGKRRDAHLSIAGCAVDRSPIAPFGRRAVSPGASTCALSVRWDARGLSYPLVVDPAWTATTSMAAARFATTPVTLTDGRVLVAGGADGAGALASAEVFDPATSTWATTGAMAVARTLHATAVLKDGRVGAFGGSGSGANTTAELYDPAAGTWATLPTMLAAHAAASATTLPNGDVLIVGGDTPAPTACERYKPVASALGSFATEPSLPHARPGLRAVQITGRVVATGGDTTSATSDEYDLSTSTWSTSLPMADVHFGGAVVAIGDWVYVFGGIDGAGADSARVEARAPSPAAWSTSPSLLHARRDLAVAVADAGAILVIGGSNLASGVLSSTERFGVSAGALSTPIEAGPLTVARANAGAVALSAGRVLVAGGDGPTSGSALASAEIYALAGAASSCTVDGECTTGHCVDGVCCDLPCDGSCQGCSAAHKGSGADGVCGPLASGVSCGTASCAAGALSSPTCDGAGTCGATASSCGAYACASTSACATSCASTTDCAADHYCGSAGTCLPTKANGQPAGDASQCHSGKLADGYCCDAACLGPCEACDGTGGSTPGHCSPVAGAPEHGSCPTAPTGGDVCQATICDGSTGERCAGFVSASVNCRAQSCDAATGTETSAAGCNGLGACPAVVTKACAPYVCDGDACRTSCRSDVDCVAGFPCDVVAHVCARSSTCVDGHTQATASGTRDCTPYACVDGACAGVCKSSSDCVQPSVCDLVSGRCTTGTDSGSSGSSGSGGCAITRSPGRSPPLAVAAIAAAWALLRARRARDMGPRRRLL